jgi:mixed-linked glucan synthase
MKAINCIHPDTTYIVSTTEISSSRRLRRPCHARARYARAGSNERIPVSYTLYIRISTILNLECDHYVNNSQALRAGACLMLDGGHDVAFVQFPQRFDGVDPGDRYANHKRVSFDCTEIGLDGLQGPIYVGTGCMFRRAALYGVDPPPPGWSGSEEAADVEPGKFFGGSASFLNSVRAALSQQTEQRLFTEAAAIAEATALVSCTYEDMTAWGRDIGWMYGTVTEDVATGF